jgi:hypothetical protein
MRIVLFVVGCILFLGGVAFMYWPAALVFAGVFLIYVAVKIGEPAKPSPSTKSVSQPDFNNN